MQRVIMAIFNFATILEWEWLANWSFNKLDDFNCDDYEDEGEEGDDYDDCEDGGDCDDCEWGDDWDTDKDLEWLINWASNLTEDEEF